MGRALPRSNKRSVPKGKPGRLRDPANGNAGASWKDFANKATQAQYKSGIDKAGAGEKLVSGYAQGVVKKKS